MYNVYRHHTSDKGTYLMHQLASYSEAVTAMKDGARGDLNGDRKNIYRTQVRNRIEVVHPNADHSVMYGVAWYIEKA